MLSLLLQRTLALAGLSVEIFCLYTSLLTDEEIEIVKPPTGLPEFSISARYGSEVNIPEKFMIGMG